MIKINYFYERELLIRREIETKAPKCYPNSTMVEVIKQALKGFISSTLDLVPKNIFKQENILVYVLFSFLFTLTPQTTSHFSFFLPSYISFTFASPHGWYKLIMMHDALFGIMYTVIIFWTIVYCIYINAKVWNDLVTQANFAKHY